MYDFAAEVIKTVYPNASIQGEPSKGTTGEFQVTITRKDGSKQMVFNKKGGDGAFSDENTQTTLVNKIGSFVA